MVEVSRPAEKQSCGLGEEKEPEEVVRAEPAESRFKQLLLSLSWLWVAVVIVAIAIGLAFHLYRKRT